MSWEAPMKQIVREMEARPGLWFVADVLKEARKRGIRFGDRAAMQYIRNIRST